MMIWDMFRRFGNTRKSRGGASTDKGRDVLKQLRNRDPRLEQFEDRVLLSVSSGIESSAFWQAQLQQAIAKASDLSSYKEEWLDQTTRWVVSVSEEIDASLLSAAFGADFHGQAALLPENFTVWDFSPETNWSQVASLLTQTGGIETFYPVVPKELKKLFVPNDPLFGDQWHLQNTGQNGGISGQDANVVPAWDHATGDGIVIGILDDGLQWDHPDLQSRYRSDLSYDFSDNDQDPSPVWSSDNHGTAVAGVAAANGNNGIGVSGSALAAELAGIRMLSQGSDGNYPTTQEIAEALVHQYQSIDVYNNSWANSWYYTAMAPEEYAALHEGVTNGRGGLGNVYVFGAANDRELSGNVNQQSFANSRYTIAVAAVDHAGSYSYYSNPGAALLVSAPSSSVYSGITTTDRTGDEGYNYLPGDADDDPLPDLDYTSTFGGTSSATPLVSGIVALMLDANPDLTYRDVQHILVETARQNDPYGSDWTANGAGYMVSHDYGFGVVDAAAAVSLARQWVNVDDELALGSGDIPVNRSIPDNSAAGVASSTYLGGQINSLEYVEVFVDIVHPSVGDLEIILTSPSGTKSVLSKTSIGETWWSWFNPLEGWTFTTTHCWGESAEGEWILEVRDQISGRTGTLNSWRLTAYGTETSAGQSLSVPPELVAIIPNDGANLTDGQTLKIGPRELTFRFNEGQVFDLATLEEGIRVVRSGGDGVFGNANDRQVEFGWIGIGERPNEIIVRFAETLPDDDYRITIFGAGEHPLLNTRGVPFHDGNDQTIRFSLDLGAQVMAVVPQPITRLSDGSLTQARNVIEVYFNDDDLHVASAQNPNFYQLINTAGTADTEDDTVILPESVSYDPVADKAVLTFAEDLAAYGSGAYRLRIGNEYRKIDTSAPSFDDPGDSFADAASLGALGSAMNAQSWVLASSIDPVPYPLEWPGGIDEPGHRDLPIHQAVEAHYMGAGADGMDGVATLYYSFPHVYGSDPEGNALTNMINEDQKDLVRNIMELFAYYAGVQFVEAEAGGIPIAVGDLRALDPTIPTGPGGVAGLGGPGGVVLDYADFQTGPYTWGSGFYTVMMHEIGHALMLGHTYDLPPLTVMGSGTEEGYSDTGAEGVYPGNADIVHLQYLYRPDSNDIDVYEFTLEASGTFSAETVAERLESVSLLDSVITLFGGNGEVVARNDDYFSNDSYVEVHLQPGTYYVAVTSTGNTEFDPTIPGTGLGGRTQGEYELHLNFVPDALPGSHLMDTTQTLFDGDADGRPGGIYNFWFTVATEDETLYVDKTANPALADGTIETPFTEIDRALALAAEGQIVRIVGNRTDQKYLAPTTYAAAAETSAVAVGDLTGNGIADMVAVNTADNSISIWLGNGDGTFTFQRKQSVGAGKAPNAVLMADLDGDGDMDIVTVNGGDNTVSVLLGNGRGQFGFPRVFNVGNGPTAVAAADLNGNGALDLIVVNSDGGNLSILSGNGDGTFKPQTQISVGSTPRSVAAGDLNGDGAIDLVTANSGNNSVAVLLGRGNGTFEAPLSYAVGGVPIAVGLADLNGNGALDIVSANQGTQNVSVLLGIGDGRFYDAVNYGAGGVPRAMVLADMDNDTAVDIVVARENDVLVLYGNGNGTFARRRAVGMGEAPLGLAVGNLNRDGTRDIVTANPTSNNVSVVLAKVDEAYEIGYDRLGNPLPDGWRLNVPKGVTVMIDAGAVLKLSEANIDVGTGAVGIDRSKGALQVLGTPHQSVLFTSYFDELFGVDHDEIATVGTPGDWGGLVFRNEYDYDYGFPVWEEEGIFLNYVAGADIRYGGGQVKVNSVTSVYNPIHMVEARPTVAFNTIRFSEDAAMSADPNSFEETHFFGDVYTADYGRVGPDIRGNRVVENSLNGIFVRTVTPAGDTLKEVEIAARWDDADIVHIVGENLVISGNPGGPFEDIAGNRTARLDGRLSVDPGVTVKLNGSRIEAQSGSQVLAEGLPGYPIIFTSLLDLRYGAGGTFDTSANTSGDEASPGDWGGIYFGTAASGSIDRALIAYGGGTTLIEGGNQASFNPIEIHQADVRIANGILEYNDAGFAGSRYGRGNIAPGTEATVFIRGAQPVIVNNIIRHNAGNALSIDVNAMNFRSNPDLGRSTGYDEAFIAYLDNYGPLVRENRMTNNGINGMLVRGGTLTTESIWDDTDIVHVVRDEIVIPNHHTYSGLRLQSSGSESLVVKLSGPQAGFTAMGVAQEIDDRIGGTLQIIGTPGHPVVLTALEDDSFGAGFDPWGNPQTNTDNANGVPTAGRWRSIRLEKYSNDRNVAVVQEREAVFDPKSGTTNDEPKNAQYLGKLAKNEKSGDDVLRLGFQVNGAIRADDTNDMDVYSFDATAGTEVWIDIDRTSQALDTVVELIDADGQVVFAASDNSYAEQIGAAEVYVNRGLAQPMFAAPMDRDAWLSKDTYSVNMMDAGMRVVLPGTAGQTRTYYVRVRSASGATGEGLTSGAYQLQVRLRATQEYPGSTVQYASIHYATNGIEMFGLPANSPLLAETSEYQEFIETPEGLMWTWNSNNDTRENAIDIGNLLQTNAAAIKVIGDISSPTDVDWFQFQIDLTGVQSIEGVNADTPAMWPVVFDIDYADGTGRPDTQIWVFDDEGRLIYRGDDSNIADDAVRGMRTDKDNLAAGSFGAKDPYVGPVFLSRSGTYYVAVTGPGMVADALKQDLIRREPVNSVNRVAEDHITLGLGNIEEGEPSEAVLSALGRPLAPNQAPVELFSGTNVFELALAVDQFHLGDVVLYVTNGADVFTIDPFTGVVETDLTGPTAVISGGETNPFGDIIMRADGRLFGMSTGAFDADSGHYMQISTADGAILYDQDDGIITYESQVDDDIEYVVANVGIQFEAMVFIPHDMLGAFQLARGENPLEPGAFLAVGNRLGGSDIEYDQNVMYLFNADGVAVRPATTPLDDPDEWVESMPIPYGWLQSAPFIGVVPAENRINDLYDDLTDGMYFSIKEDDVEEPGLDPEDPPIFIDGVEFTFELDFGFEVRYVEDEQVRDGDTFVVNGTTFEFDDGRTHILTVESFNGLADGDTFTIHNENGALANFEIDFDGALENEDFNAVYLQGVSSNNAAAQALANAINGATVSGGSALGVTATVSGSQILLSGDADGDGNDGALVSVAGLAGVSYVNTAGVAPGNRIISFDPAAGRFSVLQAAVDGINAFYADGAFAGGNRITLNAPVTSVDFAGTPAFFQTAGAAPGVMPGNVPVLVHAGMTSAEVASAISIAINTANVGGETPDFSAEAGGGAVRIGNLSDSNRIIVRNAPGLTASGGGSGGRITGLTFVNGNLYAVDDQGGFYQVDDFTTPGMEVVNEPKVTDPDADPPEEEDFWRIRHIDGVGAALMPIVVFEDAPFSGLDRGPATVGRGLTEEGELEPTGPYAEMLFATDSQGRLHAFDLEGVPQPIFFDGFSTIPTGLGYINGVTFSNIDYNLWHPTARYDETPGHGVTTAHDMSRQEPDYPIPGGTSFYFGLEDPDGDGSIYAQPGAAMYREFDTPLNQAIFASSGYTSEELLNTYDTPGGAYGALTTNTFSLAGYSRADRPKLFFNYFLDTEGGDVWDGAQVYISADGAAWDLLASNTNLYGESPLEYAFDPTVLDEEDARRVELNDDVGGGWRQAVVNLLPYAGLDNLRLRFVFSTAGKLNVGDAPGSFASNTTGAYLTAIPGNQLIDGDSLTIDEQMFEFDMGFSLVLPNVAGAAIALGETITIDGETASATLEFVEQAGQEMPGNTPVLIHAAMSTAEVADALFDAVSAAFPNDPEADPPLVGEVIAHVKDNRVYLQGAMNVATDAEALLVEGDAPGTVTGESMNGEPAVAVPIHAGMTAAEVAHALATVIDATFSEEDLPDFFTSIKVDGEFLHVIGHQVIPPDPFTGEPPLALPFSNFLMGDGEHLANDIPLDRFANNGRGQNNRFEGFYIDDIIIGFTERGEMITDAEPEDTFSPQTTGSAITTGRYELEIRTGTQYGMLYMGDLVLFSAYDTNDRMSDSLTLWAPAAKEISEGHTFTVSDGVNVVTFQFLDAALGNEPQEGAVPIVFTGEELLGELASLIAHTINSVAELDVIASHNMVETSNQIDLFGAAHTTGMDVLYFGGTQNGTLGAAIPSDVVTTTPSTDANKLRDALLGTGIMPIGDATLVSSDVSAGFWTDGRNSGILLTTGDVAAAAGPNMDGASVGDASGLGDADLDAEFGVITTDATSLEFDFAWQGGDLFLQFFFASEEFNEMFSEDVRTILEENGLTLADLAFDVMSVFVDGVNIALLPKTGIPVNASTINPELNEKYFIDNDPELEGPYFELFGYDGFTIPFNAVVEDLAAGEHHIKIVISDTMMNLPLPIPELEEYEFDSAIFLTAGSLGALRPTVYGTENYYDHGGLWQGDENRERPQGQTIIDSNHITNSLQNGIVFDMSFPDAYAHPGPAAWLQVVNQGSLVPAATIRNNLVVSSGDGGILFGGFPFPPYDGQIFTQGANAVPFGRIVNNTIYGGTLRSDSYGIRVEDYAGPTILNNIISSVGTGIEIDASSRATTVYDNTIYHNVVTPIAGGVLKNLDDVLGANDALFVDAERGNFYLDRGSVAIDSAVNVVQDRLEMSSVRDPLGIARSPILAPDYDLYGQLRTDDPSVAPPPGLGQNVFKDRGAIDRTDFAGPTAGLTNPLDNGAADRNRGLGDVYVISKQLVNFSIQLADAGVGVNNFSVVSSAVQLYRDGVLLEDGLDYFFQYNTNTKVIRLVPVAGIWADGHKYTIHLDNGADGIRDLANNPIAPNRLNGQTRFSIEIAGMDFGDAPPDAGFPTTLAQNGARHIIVPNYHLGYGVSSEPDARYNADATADTYDDGIVFPTATLRPGTQTEVAVTFTVPDDPAFQGGWLSGWIDFNGNGDWNDPGEQVFVDEMLYYDENADPDPTDDFRVNTVVFTIVVPQDAVMGRVFARFRMSTDGGLGVTGEASSGEVEDYAILIGQLTDFGDAPSDRGYPTLLAEDGARHLLGTGLFLGYAVDDEVDGLPHPQALGDDLDGIDDEDGILFDGYVLSGQTATFTVIASGTGYLNAWIDYNGDGDWDDAGEQIFTDMPLDAGTHELTVDVPAGLTPKETFGRFRFSSEAGLTPRGLAPDGEVEDYRVLIMDVARDFGDAPVSYPTLLNNNGAWHAASDLYLGSFIDYELDGQPNATATGDDMTYLDDEDGVRFPEVLVRGERTISVKVSGGGYLNAWIDLNQDGRWTGAEQVITGLWVEPPADGSEWVDVTFTIPATAQLGKTFARFRFSSVETLSYQGGAPDGEVEDYLITIGRADFGDAPQGQIYKFPATGAWADYPTKGKSAAFHLESNLRLGARIDYENDGIPTPNADGDDNTGVDDEDGVLIDQWRLPAGEQRLITVNASEFGYLNAWIDFNQDGDWDDPGEHFIIARPLTAGQNLIYVDIPETVVPGKTFARFRFSSVEDLPYHGMAPDGEVEDYAIVIGHRDYGDAPSWYEQGDPASHLLSDVFLGSLIDVELAPQSSNDALGDDLSDLDDEDGVIIPDGRLAIGRNRPITVIASTAGYLNAWIDFGQNGNWSDPGDQVLRGYELNAGTNQVFIDIPTNARVGNTFARFRFSSEQYLDPTGPAADGEVEDYRIEIYNPSSVATFPDVRFMVAEGHEGLTPIDVAVRRVGTFDEQIVFDYTTADGTATVADSDYQSASGTIVFGPASPLNPVIEPWDVQSLTGGLSNEVVYHIFGDYLVWESKVDGDWEVYLWNNSSDDTAYWPDGRPKIQKLTDNDHEDRFSNIYADGSVVHVVWASRESQTDDYEVWLWRDVVNDGLPPQVYRLSDNATDDTLPQVSATHVAWLGHDGSDREIYLLDIAERIAVGPGYQAKNISDNSFHDADPRLSGSRVVWVGQEAGDTEIYLYDAVRFELDGTEAQRITSNSTDDIRPQIDGRNVVWQNNGNIFLYQIAVNPVDQMPPRNLLQNFAGTVPTSNQNPQIGGGNIVWQGYNSGFGGGWEIFRVQIDRLNDPAYLGAGVQNLSNNGAAYDEQPAVSGSQVVWRTLESGQWDVHHYDLAKDTRATNISNDEGFNSTPLVSGSMVVWRHLGDGQSNYEIIVAERGIPYMEQSITLYVNGDTRIEDDEYFLLRVTGEGFEVEKPIWILNDDPGTNPAHTVGLDFGDAGFDPVNPLEFVYPTLLEDDGARHVVDQVLYLGDSVDTEDPAEVRPDANALGDDYLYRDDEDGVFFTNPLRQGQAATITVVASAPGKLDAWFDFNRDGSWAGYTDQSTGEWVDEKVFDSIDLAAGDNILSVMVPPSAYIGDSIARFRLSSAGGLSYTGSAPDGEVEDHLFTVGAAAARIPGDLNGDGVVNTGDLDLVRSNWGLSVTKGNTLRGDANGDGVVNTGDLDLIRANWGATLPAAAFAAPMSAANESAPAEDATEAPVYGPKTRDQAGSVRRLLTAAQDAVFGQERDDDVSPAGGGLAELAWAYEFERLRAKAQSNRSTDTPKVSAADAIFGDYR